MYRRMLAVALVALLVNLVAVRATYAATEAEKQAKFAGKVRAAVLKLGTGESARVRVRLRDKTKLEGYVSRAGEDSFAVTDFKTGATTTVPYPQVRGVGGNNLSTGAKIAIGAGIGAGIVLLILWLYLENMDD
jgi:hypothetical protein